MRMNARWWVSSLKVWIAMGGWELNSGLACGPLVSVSVSG